MNGVQVYESKSSPSEGLIGGTESRRNAIRRRPQRRNPYAAASAVRGEDGKYHAYLNMAVPKTGRKLSGAVCKKCGHAYSELLISGEPVCLECDIERIADIARALELQGVPLGWGYCGRDAYTIEPDWMRGEAETMGWSPRPKRLMQTRV